MTKSNFNVNDIVGKTFNCLTILRLSKSIKKNTKKGTCYKHLYLCECSCGNKKEIERSLIIEGHTKSCGHLNKDVCKNNFLIHGLSKTKLYKKYRMMIRRCLDKNLISYKYYGGRGIAVCDEWNNDFMSFYNWAINNGYKEDLSIDRIDVNGNYCPENCRWVSMKEQCSNRRTNIIVFYKSKKLTLKQFCEENNLDYKKTWDRYKNLNWSLEKCLTN